MVTVKTIGGEEVRIGRRLFNQLVMMSDWQIRQCGYDPASVTDLVLKEGEKSCQPTLLK